MHKSLRSLVLVAIVTLSAAPALHADVLGTNPRPTGHAIKPSPTQWFLSLFGF